MKLTEKILIGLVICSYIFQLFSFPGQNVLIYLSFMLAVLFYFLFSFALFGNISFKNLIKKESYEQLSSQHAIYAVYCGFAFNGYFIGLLYRILHWNNSKALMITGTLLLGLVLLTSGIKFIKRRTQFYKAILIRAIIFIILFGLHFLIV